MITLFLFFAVAIVMCLLSFAGMPPGYGMFFLALLLVLGVLFLLFRMFRGK